MQRRAGPRGPRASRASVVLGAVVGHLGAHRRARLSRADATPRAPAPAPAPATAAELDERPERVEDARTGPRIPSARMPAVHPGSREHGRRDHRRRTLLLALGLLVVVLTALRGAAPAAGRGARRRGAQPGRRHAPALPAPRGRGGDRRHRAGAGGRAVHRARPPRRHRARVERHRRRGHRLRGPPGARQRDRGRGARHHPAAAHRRPGDLRGPDRHRRGRLAHLHVAAHGQRRADDHPERAPGRRRPAQRLDPLAHRRARGRAVAGARRRRGGGAARRSRRCPGQRARRADRRGHRDGRARRRRGPGRGPAGAPRPRGALRADALRALREAGIPRAGAATACAAAARERPPARYPSRAARTVASSLHSPPPPCPVANDSGAAPAGGRSAPDPLPRSRAARDRRRDRRIGRRGLDRQRRHDRAVARRAQADRARRHVARVRRRRPAARLHPGQRAAPADRLHGDPPEHQGRDRRRRGPPLLPARGRRLRGRRARRRSRTSSPATRCRAARR